MDVDSKPHREMHTAMGDCMVLKKLGKDTERKSQKGKVKGGRILCWDLIILMMRARFS